MLHFKIFEQLTKNLHQSIPKTIQELTYDINIKIFKTLQKQIDRMNIIRREEFDLQLKNIYNIQEKIKYLETKIDQLERYYKINFEHYNDSKSE